MPILILRQGDDELRRYPIVRDQMTLGRDPTCDIVLADDSVSRRHARIQYAGGVFNLYCTSGTKPMVVAGRECRYATLEDTAEFRLGVFALVFQEAGGPAPEVLERVATSDLYRPKEEVLETGALSDEMMEALRRARDE